MTDSLPVAEELATAYARMSGLLLSSETVTTALRLISSLAQQTVVSSVGAGVTVVDAAGHRTTAAASDPIVAQADALQYELDEGPCLSAWSERTFVRIDDTLDDQRWPSWSRLAAELGMRSVLSAPLVAGDVCPGAMKVYSRNPGTFDERDQHLLSMFAAQAAILVANMLAFESARQLSDDLKDALRTRDVIALAKGVLIGRDGASEATALTTLAGLAKQRRITLRQAADTVVQAALRPRPSR